MNESRFGVSLVIYPDLKENSILHYKYFLFLIYNRIIQNLFLYLFTPVYNLLEFISLFIIFFIYMFNNIIWAASSESPEPPLLAHTSSESRGTFRQKARSRAPLNGWACAVKICHDRMLEDINSLDAAHLVTCYKYRYLPHDIYILETISNKNTECN